MSKSILMQVGTVVRGLPYKVEGLGSNLGKGECNGKSALTKFGGLIAANFYVGVCPPFSPIVSKVKMSL